MAERRMFAKTIIDSDAFLEMPQSSQLLYFHLGMRADDDGFVNKPKSIMLICRANDDDMRLLITKKFIIPFDSGVVVIKHWKIHNYIAKDRYSETKYIDEKASLLFDENNAYTQNDEACIQPVYVLSTQVRLGKDRLGKDNKEKCIKEKLLAMLADACLTDTITNSLSKWLEYKKFKYEEIGFKTLLTITAKKISTFGEQPVIELIDESISSTWKGIAWDKLERRKSKSQFAGGIKLDYTE